MPVGWLGAALVVAGSGAGPGRGDGTGVGVVGWVAAVSRSKPLTMVDWSAVVVGWSAIVVFPQRWFGSVPPLCQDDLGQVIFPKLLVEGV